ncbi:MAG: sensor histidine kinase, partial [Chitinispirillaceae bacterium]
LNDLLDISAIESGKLKLNRQKNSIVETIESSISLYRKLAEKRSISINKQFSSDIPNFTFDEHKIGQVVSNLLSNALKYSYDKSEIRISAERRKGSVCVMIQDFGVGIPEKDQRKLFKPFSRSSASSPSGEKSTGLGLAIVNKVVAAHNGTVSLESRVDEGTTVSFSLPLENSACED